MRQIRLPARPVPASAKDPLPARRTPRHPSSLKPPPPATTVISGSAPHHRVSAQTSKQLPAGRRPSHPSTPDYADGHDRDARQTRPPATAAIGSPGRQRSHLAQINCYGAASGEHPNTQVAAPNGGYFSPSSSVIHMSVCPRSPSRSADVTGVAPEKSLGSYSA